MKTSASKPAASAPPQSSSRSHKESASSGESIVQSAQVGTTAPPPFHQMVNSSPRGLAQRHAISRIFGASVVQRAGDPEGLMPEHHASGFTYHHIIPENKLHSLWETLESKDHTRLLKGGLGSVVDRGLDQLKSAALGNITLDLKKEIGEVTGSWESSKFEAIVADAIAGKSPEQLADTHFPGLKDPSHEYHGSYLPIKTIFNKRFKVIGESTGKNVTDTVAAEEDAFMADANAKAVVNKLLMWMPGNIHRGPSKRVTPGDAAFDKDLDDGGDSFEEAAKQVISPEHFATIKSLDQKIDAYLGNPSDTSVLPDLGKLLEKMKAFSVTDYKPENWEEVNVGTKKKPKTASRLRKKV